jgi:hypothetical protein
METTAMTAEALYTRLLLTEKLGLVVEEAAAQEATRRVLASPPSGRQINLYYWYYATLALHRRHQENEQAREAWRTWNDALVSVLVPTQISESPNTGSWDPDMEWGGYGGRVYSTALAAMCLEVYYRYAPLPASGPPAMVTRPEIGGRAR